MYLSPKEASERYNIHPKTLARLADKGIIEYILMPGSNHRRYKVSSIEKHLSIQHKTKKTVLYARVSTSGQKEDLSKQLVYLQSKYPGTECVSEIGSGMNFKPIRNSQFAIRNYVLQWGFRPQRKTSNPRGWGIKPL